MCVKLQTSPLTADFSHLAMAPTSQPLVSRAGGGGGFTQLESELQRVYIPLCWRAPHKHVVGGPLALASSVWSLNPLSHIKILNTSSGLISSFYNLPVKTHKISGTNEKYLIVYFAYFYYSVHFCAIYPILQTMYNKSVNPILFSSFKISSPIFINYVFNYM